MKKISVFICSFFLLLSGIAAAQEDWGFHTGDRTFTLQGSGTSDNEFDNTTFTIETSIGYLLTDTVELGLRQGIGYADIQNSGNQWNGSTRGYLDINFDLDCWHPFLGINLGYLYGESTNETWIAGPETGVKVFLTPKAYLMALIEYNFTFDEVDDADDNFDDGRFVYSLGFGINF